MSTYIDGIGASENIDSSGEQISIAGMDISSLAVDGVFNWEHNKDLPSQIVGKVLVAKKIFSEKDCDDERQAYFWQKCQTPFVYVMGELMDDYKDSAKEVAGMFRYDSDRQGQQERNVMNFSIEGAKLNKINNIITHSIARKVTVTVLPCNKAAVAEMVPTRGTKKPKDDLDSIFKSETTVEIELIKTQDMTKVLDTLQKSLKLVPPADPRGTHIGTTKSGKDVHSHEKVHNYQGFTSQDHKEAANLHYNAIKTGDPKTTQHHMGKMKLHMQASHSAEKREQRISGSVKSAVANSKQSNSTFSAPKNTTAPYVNIPGKDRGISKSTTLGSANVAPGQLTGGAALAKQCIDPKMHKGCSHGDLNKSEQYHAEESHAKSVSDELHTKSKELGHTGSSYKYHVKTKGSHSSGFADKAKADQFAAHAKAHPAVHAVKQSESHGHHFVDVQIKTPGEMKTLKKSEFWLQRAEQEYAQWDKKDLFLEFMSKKFPEMTKTEIEVHGAVLALKKSLESEQLLENMMKSEDTETKLEELSKALKFGDGRPAAKISPENDATPKPLPKKFHDYKKEPKGVEHTEVEHVHPHYDGKSPDTVFTKAGHRLEGHAKGKFKAGDKVTVKSHIMGTHIMHHGHSED